MDLIKLHAAEYSPTKPFKPMLAARADNLRAIPWPMLASPKLDGIRCIILSGQAISRSGKPIRNRHIQETLQAHAGILEGMDGELLVGSPTADDVYRTTSSAVMSIEGTPDFTFHIFDYIHHPQQSFMERFKWLQGREFPEFARLVTQQKVHDHDEVLAFEEQQLALGYEGVMLRHPFGPYKNERSTAREAYLLKLKRFTDAEAVCIDIGELMHNGNEAFKNELGHTARSNAQEGLVPGNTLGYLLCETPEGVQFKIGTGFTQADRDSLWAQKQDLIGRLVKYKFFNVGVKEAPRHPVWLGFRARDDRDSEPEAVVRLKENPQTNTWAVTLGRPSE